MTIKTQGHLIADGFFPQVRRELENRGYIQQMRVGEQESYLARDGSTVNLLKGSRRAWTSDGRMVNPMTAVDVLSIPSVWERIVYGQSKVQQEVADILYNLVAEAIPQPVRA